MRLKRDTMIRTFGEATLGLQRLLAEGVRLCESLEWRKYTKLREKDLDIGDEYTYRANIVSFMNDLDFYAVHYMDLDLKSFSRTKTYTTEDYFSGTVATKRKRAIRALRILRRKNVDIEIVKLLVEAINLYIETCIDAVKINPHLEDIRRRVGLDNLLRKYELMYVDIDEILS